MVEKDLRRSVLESHKTVSRKAQSKQPSRETSRPTSKPNSKPGSRSASRQPSDEEDNGSSSDGTAFSAASMDELLHAEEDVEQFTWELTLSERIQELVDRKRSSTQGREESLASYVRILMSQYASNEIEDKIPELLASFGKSIKAESSEKETVLALKAVTVTILTHPEDHFYGQLSKTLQRTITESTSLPTKAEAIHCLGTVALFGGDTIDDTADAMTFLLEIISTDGTSIEADDDAATVIAALQEWGLLATNVKDLSEESQELVEVFMDQLDSDHVGVQIAAGENIAMLYEKSCIIRTDDDSDDTDEDEEAEDFDDTHLSDEERKARPVFKKNWTMLRNKTQLVTKIEALAKLSTHKIAKKSKRELHSSFAAILATIENPNHGPHYSKAVNDETGKDYGNRKLVRINKVATMSIDRWWKWIRFNALRRVLGGGFAAHYFNGNMVLLDCLPIMLLPQKEKDWYQETREDQAKAEKLKRIEVRLKSKGLTVNAKGAAMNGKDRKGVRGVMGWDEGDEE